MSCQLSSMILLMDLNGLICILYEVFNEHLLPILNRQLSAEIKKIHRIGDEGIRTPDPLLARQVLSQLSYTP